ncbi:MAG: SUMF1/EgtB/PvdO family nonheme iron enzyme [Synechococcales cyanobacterium]
MGSDQRYRACRGGSWYDGAKYLRSANRNWNLLDYRNSYVGFRLVLSF